MDNLYSYEILSNVTPNAKYNSFSNNLIFTTDKHSYKYYIFVNEYDSESKEISTYVLLGDTKFNPQCSPCGYNEYGQLRINIIYPLINYFKTHKLFQLKHIDSTHEYDKYAIIVAAK